MIQKGVRVWKKIFGRGEGRATDSSRLYQYWPSLWCGGVSLSFSFGDGLDEYSSLCWGGPVCDDLSDCGPLVDLEYGLDRVFDKSPEYVDESAYVL